MRGQVYDAHMYKFEDCHVSNQVELNLNRLGLNLLPDIDLDCFDPGVPGGGC